MKNNIVYCEENQTDVNLNDKRLSIFIKDNPELSYYFDDNINNLNLNYPLLCVIIINLLLILFFVTFDYIYFPKTSNKKYTEHIAVQKDFSIFNLNFHYNYLRYYVLFFAILSFCLPIIFTMIFHFTITSKTQFSLYLFAIYFILSNIPNYHFIKIINNPDSKVLYYIYFFNICFFLMYLVLHKYLYAIYIISITLFLINFILICRTVLQYKFDKNNQIISIYKKNYLIFFKEQIINQIKRKIETSEVEVGKDGVKKIINILQKKYSHEEELLQNQLEINKKFKNLKNKNQINDIEDILFKENIKEQEDQHQNNLEMPIIQALELELKIIEDQIAQNKFYPDKCLFVNGFNGSKEDRLIYGFTSLVYIVLLFIITMITSIYFFYKDKFKKIIDYISDYIILFILAYVLIYLVVRNIGNEYLKETFNYDNKNNGNIQDDQIFTA